MNQKEFSQISDFTLNHLQNVFGNASHPKEVRRLAEEIYQQLMNWYQLEQEDCYLLEIAALLHDTGAIFGEKQHHKNSFEYIMNLNFPCPKEEKLIIANIARYHRKALPSNKHHNFKILSPNQKYLIIKLSAILRLADALDRSHAQNIEHLDLRLEDSAIYFEIHPKNCLGTMLCSSFQIEKYGFEKKKDLFEQVFKKNTVLTIKFNN